MLLNGPEDAMCPAPVIPTTGRSSPGPPANRRRMASRFNVQAILVLVACAAALLWALRKISDDLSPVRDIARRVEYDMEIDRETAIETLTYASGTEIDVALPALIKLQDNVGPADRGRLLSAIASLLEERLSPSAPASSKPAPEVAAREALSVLDVLDDALKSPEGATRVGAARSLRRILSPDAILAVLVPGPGSPRTIDVDELMRVLETAVSDPQIEVRIDSVTALGYLAVALDREPPSALRQALKDPSRAVQSSSAVAVSRFRMGIEPCLPDLFRFMTDVRPVEEKGSLQFNQAISECYSGLTQANAQPTVSALPVLTDALFSPSGDVRAVAAVLLGRIGPDAAAAVPELVQTLRRTLDPAYHSGKSAPNPWERREIAAAIQKTIPDGPILQREVVPILVEALQQGDLAYARWDGIEALKRLGPVAEPAIPVLIDVMERLPRDQRSLSEAVARAIVQIARGTPSADRARAALREAYAKKQISRDLAHDLDGFNQAAPAPR